MKKLLAMLLLLLVSCGSRAEVDGVWIDSKGEYWVLFHESSGAGFALKVDAGLVNSTLWSGAVSGSSALLTGPTGEEASLTVDAGGAVLSGTVGGQPFAAGSVFAHFGGAYDGAYAVGNGRYLLYLTLKDGAGTSVLLLDVVIGDAGITNQVYWGRYSTITRQYRGDSLTTSGGVAELSFDDAGLVSGSILGASVSGTSLIAQALPEVASDYLGYYVASPGYAQLAGKNVKVVNLPEEDSFFAIYQPASVQKNRVMVVIHGTDGTPYEEIKDEVAYADQYGYVVVGVQWLNKGTATYASPASVYRMIGKALDHLKRTTGNDLSRVAYVGFSRGSAISYEVTWRDLQSRRLFDLTISHSGGIPTQLPHAPVADDPGVFYNALSDGTLGGQSMWGSKFFLYCGEKDEQFGTQMCVWVNNAKTLIERGAGSVLRLIDDPLGKHAGYRMNAAYHAAGVQAFIDATP